MREIHAAGLSDIAGGRCFPIRKIELYIPAKLVCTGAFYSKQFFESVTATCTEDSARVWAETKVFLSFLPWVQNLSSPWNQVSWRGLRYRSDTLVSSISVHDGPTWPVTRKEDELSICSRSRPFETENRRILGNSEVVNGRMSVTCNWEFGSRRNIALLWTSMRKLCKKWKISLIDKDIE